MLFTVSAIFSDFTVAYEQYDADNPSAALGLFLLKAEALSAYNKGVRSIAVLEKKHELTHVANGQRGLWLWHLTDQLEHEEVALYGGAIIQTDVNGPIRGISQVDNHKLA